MAWPADGSAHIITYSLIPIFSKAVTLAASGDLCKCSLYLNTNTPTNTTTTAATSEYNGTGSQWLTTYELTTTGGYTVGGLSLTAANNLLGQSTNVFSFSNSTTTQWTSASFSTYGCLVYDSTTSNYGLSYHDFDGVQTVSGSGTFTINWNAGGIFKITCS